MNSRKILPLALVLFASTAAVAHADVFVGASVGDASISDDGVGFDGSDTGFKVFAGWTFFKFVGLEASYVDFGEAKDELSGGTDLQVDFTGWDVFVTGNLPIGDHFELFAKYGVIVWDAEQSISGISGSASDDGNDPVYGAGLKFKFGGFFGIRAEYEVFDVEDADVEMASAGVEFRF